MGTKLYQVFLAAGLETPQLCSEALIGGGRDWVERFTAACGALLPLMLRNGVATEEEIGIATFERRYREELLSQGSIVQWLTCVGQSSSRSAPSAVGGIRLPAEHSVARRRPAASYGCRFL